MDYYTDKAATCLMLLSNATGAEFEDEHLAVDIIAETIKNEMSVWHEFTDNDDNVFYATGKEILLKNKTTGNKFVRKFYPYDPEYNRIKLGDYQWRMIPD